MTTPIPRTASGGPDGPNFRNDAPLTGLEVWLHGTHTELDTALAVLDGAGHLLWRSERRRLHGTADSGRHSVYVRVAVAAESRPVRTGQPKPGGGELIDLAAARRQRTSA